MQKISASIIGAAIAAGNLFVFPLTINPLAAEDCADPSFHFVMSDAMGTTVPDTTNAKESFCRVVEKNVELWK